jgi:PAS domain S-box-containing protein
MESELSQVVNALPGLVCTASPAGDIDFLNQQWFDYTGFSRDQSYGGGWQAAVHPEELDATVGRWEAIISSAKADEMVLRLRRFDGAYRRFLMRISPLTDAAGHVVKWCGVGTDIDATGPPGSERRPGWRPLAPERETHFQLETYFRAIVDGLPAMVTLISPTGELAFANRQTLDYFGATLREMQRWTRASTLHPDDRAGAAAAWLRSIELGTSYNFEARQHRADGIYRWFHLQGFPLRDADGTIVLWYLLQTDIDNRKRAEDLLSREKRLLEMVARGLPLTAGLDALCELVEATMDPCCCGILLVDPTATTFRRCAAPSLSLSFKVAFEGTKVDPAHGPCGMAVADKTQVIATDVAADPRWAHSPWSGLMTELDLRSCWSTPILSGDGTVLGVLAIYQRGPATPTAQQQDLIEQLTIIVGIAIERALKDAALKQSEARKAAILESALDCIVTIDHDGLITEFNRAAERTFGHRREAVLGRRLGDIIVPPSLREQHNIGMARYLATGEARVLGRRIEMTAMRANGAEFPVELTVTRIEADGPPSFTGYLRDITERTTSEANLRRSEAYLAKAQTLSRTGSFGWKVATEEHFWSDETFSIFEYDRSTPVSLQAILQRVHPLDVQLVTQVIALAAKGHDFDYECRLLIPGGPTAGSRVKHVHIVAHGTRGPHGDLEYIGAIQDVTERRVSEEALGALRTELAHVARVTSLGALTASIAHEVNQPLAGIITNASTCLRMLGSEPPNIDGARETARRTIRDGNRASDVVSRLRALFSKKQATTEAVDLNEAATEVIALLSRELQRGQVIVRAELADDLPPVPGDRVQLQQVILNLLLNAADAMSGVEERQRHLVIRTAREADLGARVTVQDNGVGFEPNAAEKLFEAFYTTKTGGMGIGLSVSRSIIMSHRGRLWATANDGPGAAFSFSIPGANEAAPAATPAATSAGSSKIMSVSSS